MMADAFYLPLGEGRYRSTEHTAGPWVTGQQHLGPPSALLGRALERCAPRQEMTLARVTMEILGPVPIEDLRVTSRVERSGRAVELLSAELATEQRPVVRASAWRIARADTTDVLDGLAKPLAAPETGRQMYRQDGWLPGYLDAMEWSALSGGLDQPGPGTAWARQRVPLVDGEEPTGLQRLLAVADSGSGLSSRLDPRQWLFVNTELTVHLLREPAGEWIGLDANTEIGPNGIGTATSTLHDRTGPVGHGAQALLVRPR